MIAYNKAMLDNVVVQQEAAKAFKQGCISNEEKSNIDGQYPVSFYTPNLFIRLGMFVLTYIITFFSLGFLLFLLMSDNSSDYEKAIGIICLIFSIIAYILLEVVVRSKNNYRSGIDDGLMWMVVGISFGSIMALAHMYTANTVSCAVLFIIAGFISVRFANRIISVIAYLSFLGILFFLCSYFGGIIKAIVPFILMTASAGIYFIIDKIKTQQRLRYHIDCLEVVSVATLITFYAAGNYYVVRELSNAMFDLNLLPGQTIPFGWLFWIFTIITPIAYLGAGIKNKSTVFIRVAMLLFAATCFTIRNYYSFAPVEIIMTIGGTVLIIGAYSLMNFLAMPKNGFTYEEILSDSPIDGLQIESLLIAEILPQQHIPADTNKFGGGSFGGGGAAGEY